MRRRQQGTGGADADTGKAPRTHDAAGELRSFYQEHDESKVDSVDALIREHGIATLAAALHAKYGAVPTGWSVPKPRSRMPALLAFIFLAAALACGYVGGTDPTAMSQSTTQTTGLAKTVTAAAQKAAKTPAEVAKVRIAIKKADYAINTAVAELQLISNTTDMTDGERHGMLSDVEKNLRVAIDNPVEGSERQQYLAHSSLAYVLHSYYHTTRADEALHHYGAASKLPGAEADVRFHWGSLLYKRGRLDEAVGSFRAAIKDGMDSAAIYHNLAVTYAMLDKDADSDAMFDEAQKRDPELSERVGLTTLAGDLTSADTA